jgi:acetylserotonin N-methyltransferase
MTTSGSPAGPEPVIDLIEAFRRSQTMFTATSLGVFDAVPGTAAEFAATLGANTSALELLLDACAALGLLEKTGGVYRNTPTAERYLRSASSESLRGYVMYSHRALYPMWAHLDDAVRDGSHRWAQTFGIEGPIFSHFFRTDEALHDFLMGMHGFGMLTSPKVVSAFDLARFGTLVDLGGATGHLAIAACERYPGMRAVVFELPQAVWLAREITSRSTAAGRIEVVVGDFFEDELPPAELYALGQVLHDWTEEKIVRLLEKIVRTLPEHGGLLIAEKLLNDDGVGPVPANMQSLNMLVCTEGRERSAAEYERLLRAAGFAQVDARRTGTPRDAVLAIKGR